MKHTTLVLVLLALVGIACCGVSALGLTAFLLTQMQPVAVPVQTVPVAVALLDLPAGTSLDAPDGKVALKPHLPETVPPGAISNFDDLRGKTLARAIERGAPVTVRDLRPAEPLFKPLPPGLKFTTIQITGVQDCEAVEMLGKWVAISVSFPDPSDADRILTESVVEKAFVVAANTRSGETPLGTPDSITVGVPPDQLEALTALNRRGTVNVMLRPAAPLAGEPGVRALTFLASGTLSCRAEAMVGKRVDVSVTFADPENPGRSLTEPVVENVLVLGVRPATESPRPGSPPSITVAVKSDQVTALVAARYKGKLNVTLRPKQPAN